MKPHGQYRSQPVFCWLPTKVWASDFYRDGFVWFARAERRVYRNGRVKHFRIVREPVNSQSPTLSEEAR